MIRNLLTIAFVLATATPAHAQTDDHGASQLNGQWTLDLRPTNTAPAYIKSIKGTWLIKFGLRLARRSPA